jgi:hypothetical protein
MTQISAGNNISIDMQPERWRLILNGEASARVLLEANVGQPLRYGPSFGNTRRLPGEGVLATNSIQQVVLGWSNGDEAWHLGLVLEPSLADARGSRWCEMAHWPDPDASLFVDIATEAGESLARTINRPFNPIAPRIQDKPAPPPPPPLPDLPLKFGVWSFDRAGKPKNKRDDHNSDTRILQFTRASNWVVSKIVRVLWYTVWLAVYLILSIATLTSGLALPNAGTMLPSPQLLPYLGLVSAVILIGMILYIFYELLTKPDKIIIDPTSRTVTALRGQRERWQVAGSDVQSIYVTQVLNKKGKQYIVQHGELNLHRGGGEFWRMFEQPKEEELARPWKAEPSDGGDTIFPLTRDAVNSDLQAAGLYVAEALNVPSWYDRRVK